MIQELEDVILECDLPKHSLRRGDIGTVVLIHRGGEGYEVEFTTLDGETVAVVTLLAAQVRPAHKREIAHARDWLDRRRSSSLYHESRDSPT